MLPWSYMLDHQDCPVKGMDRQWLEWTSEHILVLDTDADHLYYVQGMSRRAFMSTWTNFDEIGQIGPPKWLFCCTFDCWTIDFLSWNSAGLSCQCGQIISKLVELYLCHPFLCWPLPIFVDKFSLLSWTWSARLSHLCC